MGEALVKEPSSIELGRRLRVLREARGLRREVVAVALDTGAENWRQYEVGKYHLPAAVLPVLAKVFGLSVPELSEVLLAPETPLAPVNTSKRKQAAKNSSRIANYNYTEPSRMPAFALA